MKRAFLLLTVPFFWAGALWAEGIPPFPAQEEPEILAQGPVHEAFAEPINLSAEAALTAPFAPPAPIAEAQPAEQPSLQSIWIPGYWAWDEARQEYIWVSGCWRVVPVNKRWTPGYWTKTNIGWVWTSGYWATVMATVQQPQYLPSPPTLENIAPIANAPDTDMIWVPPCWYWRQESYTLRSGYWLNASPGWIWQPSHYVWTPRGHVFVSGYWDYPLTARGILYAPVRFSAPIYHRPGFSLSLGTYVNLGWMELNLFSAPRYGHYFFGDYYDASYVGFGIFPWFHYRTNWTGYDPIHEHRRWCGRKTSGTHWDDHDRRDFDRRRHDKSLRPPRTYREIASREPQHRSLDRDNHNSPLIRVDSGKTPWHPTDADTTRPSARPRDNVLTGSGPKLRLPIAGNTAPSPTLITTPETTAEQSGSGGSAPPKRDNALTGSGPKLRLPIAGNTAPSLTPITTPETTAEQSGRGWSTPPKRDNVLAGSGPKLLLPIAGNTAPSPTPITAPETPAKQSSGRWSTKNRSRR